MQNVPSKKLIVTQIIFIFVLPIVLLYFGILSENWRIPLLSVSALLLFGIIHHEDWTHEELGLDNKNFFKALPPYFYFTLAGVLVLVAVSLKANFPDVDTKAFFVRTFSLFIPVSFFQEFAFRTFLIPRLKKIFYSRNTVIIVNAILFSFIHIIYPNLAISIPITFISGLIFARLYLKYPNLWLVTLSHMALNLTAVLLGFFYIK